MENLSASLQALKTHHSHSHSHGRNISPAQDFDKTTVLLRHSLAYESLQEMMLPERFPTAWPPPYKPLRSSTPLSRLTPIPLLHMKLGLTHYCRSVFGTLCVDAFLMSSSIFTCLEVENGMAVRLCIHNAASPAAFLSHVQKLFPKGARVAVKEPYLKRSLDGIVGIRIDNLSDIEILDKPACRPELDLNALRKEGNRRFQEKDWDGAIDSYTRCIQLIIKKGSSKSRQEALSEKNSDLLAYSNRAETWMKLNKFEQALQDSIRALEIDPNHVKSLFRKGRALQGLQRHKKACASLQEALQKDPESREICDALQESERHCTADEIETEGDFRHAIDYLIATVAGRVVEPPKCCDYTGPVVVKMTSDGRGRGLFASRDVKVGELLLVSNPIAIHYYGQDTVKTTHNHGRKAVNITEFVTKVHHLAKSSSKALYQLYNLQADSNCGNSMVPPMETLSMETDRNWAPQSFTLEDLDRARISRIISYNSYRGQVRYPKSSTAEGTSLNFFRGIWLLPSFVNHSCVHNVKMWWVGEVILIHAASSIEEGEEITIAYFQTAVPLYKRREECQARGFSCKCKRCVVEESLSVVLEPISSRFGGLYKEAIEEATVAVKAGKALPARLPKCARFAGLAVRLHRELEIGLLRNLTALEKNWIRASYATAYMAGMLVSDSPSTLSREELGEAMNCAAPGNISAILLHTWSPLGVKGSFSGALDACLRAFGEWDGDVLQTLVNLYADTQMLPFP